MTPKTNSQNPPPHPTNSAALPWGRGPWGRGPLAPNRAHRGHRPCHIAGAPASGECGAASLPGQKHGIRISAVAFHGRLNNYIEPRDCWHPCEAPPEDENPPHTANSNLHGRLRQGRLGVHSIRGIPMHRSKRHRPHFQGQHKGLPKPTGFAPQDVAAGLESRRLLLWACGGPSSRPRQIAPPNGQLLFASSGMDGTT